MEPDGKRYTVNYCRVRYLHWDFHLRLSALTGPQVCDVRFRGDRVAYELGLSEIAVFHSAQSPIHKVADNVDSGALIGTLPGVGPCLRLNTQLMIHTSPALFESYCCYELRSQQAVLALFLLSNRLYLCARTEPQDIPFSCHILVSLVIY